MSFTHLFMSVLFNSHIFVSLQNSCSRYRCLNRSMAVREQTLHDLNLLNLVTYFMAYHMVSFGKCPIILEKNVYFAIGWSILQMLDLVGLVLLKNFYVLASILSSCSIHYWKGRTMVSNDFCWIVRFPLILLILHHIVWGCCQVHM